MSINKLTATLACSCLGLSLAGQAVQANCVTEAMGATAYFDTKSSELVLPLVELAGTTSGDSEYLATRLLFQPNSNPPSFALTHPFTNPGEDCEFISISVANYDMNLQQLHIPDVAVLNGNDDVVFYSVSLKLGAVGLTLIPESLKPSEGRYSGVVYNQETQQPLKDAKVSLDGVAAEQSTNAAGHFTITGISTSICQTLTINSEGFAPLVKEVDIRYGGLKACATVFE